MVGFQDQEKSVKTRDSRLSGATQLAGRRIVSTFRSPASLKREGLRTAQCLNAHAEALRHAEGPCSF